MRKFLYKSAAVIGLLGLVFLLLLCIRYCAMSSMSWKIPVHKHVLFMGASHVEHGIDDNLLQSAINCAQSSERYMFTYLKLEKMFEANPQIDTVFLECAPTDLWEHTDDKYYNPNEQSFYIPLYWPLFTAENRDIYGNCKLQALETIVCNLYKVSYYLHNSLWKELGGYVGREQNNQVMKREEVKPNLVKGAHGHRINYHYLRKIIYLCKQHDVKLYLLYCPVYKPEYYYDQEAYYRAYNEHFSDAELLDYSHFPLADEERFDAHHLNHEGAEKFTKELTKRFNLN